MKTYSNNFTNFPGRSCNKKNLLKNQRLDEKMLRCRIFFLVLSFKGHPLLWVPMMYTNATLQSANLVVLAQFFVQLSTSTIYAYAIWILLETFLHFFEIILVKFSALTYQTWGYRVVFILWFLEKKSFSSHIYAY